MSEQKNNPYRCNEVEEWAPSWLRVGSCLDSLGFQIAFLGSIFGPILIFALLYFL